MADGKQQEVEKDRVAKVEEGGVASRVIKFLKFASNYGKEDRYDPDFTWYGMISSHHLSCTLVRALVYPMRVIRNSSLFKIDNSLRPC